MDDFAESSMGFDMEHVRPFLEQVEASLSLGLPVDAMVAQVEQTEQQATSETELTVSYDGEQVPMKFAAFMDDIDAPDLYFHVGSDALAEAIDAEMEKFCEANDM